MSKNKKVIFASVGVLLALISSVLLIRSPEEKEVIPSPPEPISETTLVPDQPTPPKEMDDSHEKVTALIDSTSEIITNQAPGIWVKVTDSWDWLMGFEAKYAVILLALAVFVVGLVGGKGRNNRKQH